jgi:hypothetical protein
MNDPMPPSESLVLFDVEKGGAIIDMSRLIAVQHVDPAKTKEDRKVIVVLETRGGVSTVELTFEGPSAAGMWEILTTLVPKAVKRA